MQKLLPREVRVLNAIKDYWREEQRAPSQLDLEKRVGLTSLPLRRHLKQLETKGAILPRRYRCPRDIYLTKQEAA